MQNDKVTGLHRKVDPSRKTCGVHKKWGSDFMGMGLVFVWRLRKIGSERDEATCTMANVPASREVEYG